jgi:molybdopterin converting factor small subunit
MKVLMPSALLSYTGAAQVEADGTSVGELFEDLDMRFPGLRFRAIDEQGKFRRHIRCFVNGEQTFDLDRALAAQDEVVLVQALSGG